MSSLNILDIVILVITVLSIIFGFIKGFIREIFSLLFLIIAGILAFLFYNDAGTFLMKYIGNRNVSNFTGFLSIFILVVLIGSLVTFFIKKILTIGPLKAVDRILGGVFGLIRGILISGILLFGLIAFPIKGKLVEKSTFTPFVTNTLQVFVNLLPEKIKKQYHFNRKRSGKIA